MLKLISNDVKLDFDSVLIVPQRTTVASRKSIFVERPDRKFKFYYSDKEWSGLPIMVANMACTGTLKMAEVSRRHNVITCLHKYGDINQQKEFFDNYRDERFDYAWVSIGMSTDPLAISNYYDGESPNICIDVANGYTDTFVKYCAVVRKTYPDSIIMAGNVCTTEMVQELIINGGVDIVKIGIGPGSACTTRIQTGVGYPQLSAIAECAATAHGLKSGERRMGLICADGGCRHPGDVCKAFCAGADFVMLGGIFAGTDECEGEWEYGTDKEKQFLKFYGMSSFHAQEKHNGGRKDYRGSEGRVVKVPYKGPAHDVFLEIKSGISSCASYIGATSIKDMPKCAKFVLINHGNTYNKVFEQWTQE